MSPFKSEFRNEDSSRENNLENIQIKKRKGWIPRLSESNFTLGESLQPLSWTSVHFGVNISEVVFLSVNSGFSIQLFFCMDVSLFLLSPENRRYFWLGMTSMLPTALWTAFLPRLNVFWELVRFWMSKQNGLALCQPSRKKKSALPF